MISNKINESDEFEVSEIFSNESIQDICKKNNLSKLNIKFSSSKSKSKSDFIESDNQTERRNNQKVPKFFLHNLSDSTPKAQKNEEDKISSSKIEEIKQQQAR